MGKKRVVTAITAIVLLSFILGYIGYTKAQKTQENLQGAQENPRSAQENLRSTQEKIERMRIQQISGETLRLSVEVWNIYKKILEAEDLRPELKRQRLAGGIDKDTLEKANKIIYELYQILSDLEGKFIQEIGRLETECGSIEAEALQADKERWLLRLEEMRGDIEFLKRAVWKAIIALHSI